MLLPNATGCSANISAFPPTDLDFALKWDLVVVFRLEVGRGDSGTPDRNEQGARGVTLQASSSYHACAPAFGYTSAG